MICSPKHPLAVRAFSFLLNPQSLTLPIVKANSFPINVYDRLNKRDHENNSNLS